MIRYKFTLFSLIALTIVVKVSFGQDAVNLLRNMDNLISAPNDKQGIVEMTLTNKSEKEKGEGSNHDAERQRQKTLHLHQT